MRRNKILTHQAGFTMVELIVVMLIMVIVAAVAIMRSNPSTPGVITEADILKTHLRFAQLKALQEDRNPDGSTAYWGINFSNNSYSLYTYDSTWGSASVNLPSETSPTHNLSSGVTVTAPSPNPVGFDGWGNPVNSSLNELSSNVTITLSGGSQTATVTIIPSTGYVQ